MSPTGIRFTHLLGAVFVVGGVIFMLFLEQKGFLFGIPYAVIGLVLIGGARGVSRRTRVAADQAGVGSPAIDDAASESASSDRSASSIHPDKKSS